MIEQFFVWRQIVNPFVGLDRVVKVDEAQQAEMTALAVFKGFLLVPHLHDGADHALGLAVGLGPFDPRKLLTDAGFITGFDESMFASALKFLAVV